MVLFTLSSFQLLLPNFEPFRGHTFSSPTPGCPTPPTRRPPLSPSLAFEVSTPPSSHPRHITTSPHHDPPHQYTYIEHHGWTQAADRLTHPASRSARFFVRQGAFAAASKLEDDRGFTAGNRGGRRKKFSLSGGPPR